MQHGVQPIRVFYDYIEADFLGIRTSLNELKPNKNIDKVVLEVLTINSKVIGPSTNGTKITLHDTFLSFLWAYIYSIVVTAPMGGKEVTQDENLKARELRNYAISLMQEYHIWDKENLPNPELFEKDEKRFIGVANSVFIASVRFIFLHEFAHIYLEHPFVSSHLWIPENIHKMEVDADNVAILWAIHNFEPNNEFTDKLSLITALNSLSFSPSKFHSYDTHPSPEDRILLCLERLKIEDNDFLWGYALWSIMEWQTNFELFYLPVSYKQGDNLKEHFLNLIKELKEYKNTGISKLKK